MNRHELIPAAVPLLLLLAVLCAVVKVAWVINPKSVLAPLRAAGKLKAFFYGPERTSPAEPSSAGPDEATPSSSQHMPVAYGANPGLYAAFSDRPSPPGP